MKKIKVCHVVSGLKAGGVESMILNFCSNMDSNKYTWFLLYQHEPSQKNVEEFSELGFFLKRIPSKVKHPIQNYRKTYKYLKENEIDVVHCHMTLMNFIPLIAAKRLKIKIRISHSHNSDVRKKNIVIRIIENQLKKLCIKNATDYVACGIDAGKYLYGNKKFIVINNAMDLNKYKYNSEYRKNNRKKYGIKENDFLIGHIGRFTNQKNHVFLIEIFKEICKEKKNAKLMLIGDGEEKSKIIELVKKYHLDNSIIFTGIISNTSELYSAFDLFVLPSLWEGFPVVAIEAQAAGLQCFFSKNIDLESKIIDKTKFISINSKNEWVNEIISFSKPLNIEEDRIINEMKFINKGLNINTEKEKLEKIYVKD